MFQILIKDQNGCNVLLREQMPAEQADLFVQSLTNSGISAVKIEREERKINVVSVIFKLDDIKTYTFEDNNGIAKVGDIIEVECTDGRIKPALVKAAGKRTRHEINEFCKRIGYTELGKVKKLVWRASGK